MERLQSILAQYHECCEYLRYHDRAIWQTPLAASTIGGALAAFNFAYVKDWRAREIILVIAFLLVASLFYALLKHRYFAEVEQGTLAQLERTLDVKLIQRTTSPVLGEKAYYFPKKPAKCLRWSAVTLFKYAMILLLVALVVLIGLNPFILVD